MHETEYISPIEYTPTPVDLGLRNIPSGLVFHPLTQGKRGRDVDRREQPVLLAVIGVEPQRHRPNSVCDDATATEDGKQAAQAEVKADVEQAHVRGNTVH